jgi:hypothetical protein
VNEFRAQLFGERKEVPLFTSKHKRGVAGADLTQVTVPRHEVRSQDMREGDRHRLSNHVVAAIHRRRRHQVELINLSGGGAMIAGDLAPNLWDRIVLDFGKTGRIETAVRWVKDGRLGLEFAHETQIDCSEEERESLLREVIERNFADLQISIPAASSPAEAPADESDPESRRSELRHPLIWSATVNLNGHESVVRLRNISSHGALIESDMTLCADSTLLLEIGGAGTIGATVSWAIGDQAGILFDTAFDVQQLAVAKPEIAPADPVAPVDSATSSEGWGRASINELANSLEGFLKR